jgi:uncharacterized protein YbjT (DUF2867 family)
VDDVIVVTAPTSTIGSQLLERLLDQNAELRVIARDPARLTDRTRQQAEVVTGSHSEPEVVDAAFKDADAVFWLTPSDPVAPSVMAAYVDFTRPAAEAFKRYQVERVVGITALGRGTPVAGNAGHVTASLAMDDLIASTGVSYRALAMPSFMDNLLRQIPAIKQGVLSWPISGDMRLPWVATRDIAAVAARFLLDDEWRWVEEVPVLGPEDLSLEDMARTLTEVLGRPVRFRQQPTADFKAGLVGFGMSEAMAQAMLDMFVAKDQGLDSGVRRSPATSTPTTFRQWCAEVLKPAMAS